MYPWVKEIQVCSNEGPRPFPRGGKNKIAKICGQILKIFSRTTVPISFKLELKASLGKEGFKLVHIEGASLFPRRVINKIAKVHS